MFNKIFQKTLTSRHSKVQKENKNNYQIEGAFFYIIYLLFLLKIKKKVYDFIKDWIQ